MITIKNRYILNRIVESFEKYNTTSDVYNI